MYGIDWDAPLYPEKKKYKPWEKKKLSGYRPQEPVPKGKRELKVKKPKLSPAEVRAKAGKSNSNSAWRRHTPDKGASMQSATGYGDADFSMSNGYGRVAPRYCPYDREWNE